MGPVKGALKDRGEGQGKGKGKSPETIEHVLAQMQGHRVYFDTNILIYILENAAGYVHVCLPFFQAMADQSIVGCTGEMTLAELLVKPMRINDMISMDPRRRPRFSDILVFDPTVARRNNPSSSPTAAASPNLPAPPFAADRSGEPNGVNVFARHRRRSGIDIVSNVDHSRRWWFFFGTRCSDFCVAGPETSRLEQFFVINQQRRQCE